MQDFDNVILPMYVKFKKIYDDTILPFYGSEEAAGLDCTVYSKSYNHDKKCFEYGLGFAVEIPKGYVGLLFPRSSVFKYGVTLSNSIGVIDADYRGEVSAKFYDTFDTEGYEIGEKCCQLIIMPYPKIHVVEAKELSETKRGSNGYGSTGK